MLRRRQNIIFLSIKIDLRCNMACAKEPVSDAALLQPYSGLQPHNLQMQLYLRATKIELHKSLKIGILSVFRTISNGILKCIAL